MESLAKYNYSYNYLEMDQRRIENNETPQGA